MHLNQQVIQRIDAKGVAWRQNRRRTVFRDDCRAGERISRDQCRAIVHRGVVRFAVEEHRSMACERLLSVATDDRSPDRFERLAAGYHAHANIYYFHLVLFFCEPITNAVQVVKSIENVGAEGNIQFVALPLVAEVKLP
jgi:hypothetical protein